MRSVDTDIEALTTGSEPVPEALIVRAALRLEWDRQVIAYRHRLWLEQYAELLPESEVEASQLADDQARMVRALEASYPRAGDQAAVMWALGKAASELGLPAILRLVRDAGEQLAGETVEQAVLSIEGFVGPEGWRLRAAAAALAPSASQATVALLQRACGSARGDVRRAAEYMLTLLA